MNNYLIRKKIVSNSITIVSFTIFVFFISHIFFGERSFELPPKISKTLFFNFFIIIFHLLS